MRIHHTEAERLRALDHETRKREVCVLSQACCMVSYRCCAAPPAGAQSCCLHLTKGPTHSLLCRAPPPPPPPCVYAHPPCSYQAEERLRRLHEAMEQEQAAIRALEEAEAKVCGCVGVCVGGVRGGGVWVWLCGCECGCRVIIVLHPLPHVRVSLPATHGRRAPGA